MTASDLPAAAITAATNAAGEWARHSLMSRAEVGYRDALVIAALEAAAPHLTAADPTTESEGFRAWKASVAAGRAEGAAAERQRIRQDALTVAASFDDGAMDYEAGLFRTFADRLKDAP